MGWYLFAHRVVCGSLGSSVTGICFTAFVLPSLLYSSGATVWMWWCVAAYWTGSIICIVFIVPCLLYLFFSSQHMKCTRYIDLHCREVTSFYHRFVIARCFVFGRRAAALVAGRSTCFFSQHIERAINTILHCCTSYCILHLLVFFSTLRRLDSGRWWSA